jgi:Copper transport outer membrane protein, MctB
VVSFRYHLVSVGAVLLALAAGVVLGAGPLSTKVSEALTPAKPSASVDTGATVAALKASAAAKDAYIAATSRALVTGQLHRTRVVLVIAPGTPARLAASVTAMLVQAGATVSGSVSLTVAWADPGQATVLDGITNQLAPPGTAVTTGSGAAQAAAALAAALVTRQASALGQTSDPATALLAGLVQAGFLTRTGSPDQAASLAVLLAPVTEPNAAGLLPLMSALRAAGRGVVVAAPTGSAKPGGVVAVLRGDAATRALVSTVDSADLISGRVALVLALVQQRAGGHGQYGSGPGADAPVPRR